MTTQSSSSWLREYAETRGVDLERLARAVLADPEDMTIEFNEHRIIGLYDASQGDVLEIADLRMPVAYLDEIAATL